MTTNGRKYIYICIYTRDHRLPGNHHQIQDLRYTYLNSKPQKSADGNIYVSKRFPAKTFLVNVGSERAEYLLEREGALGLASSRGREKRDTIVTPRLSVFCNIFMLTANCLLSVKNITLLMREHNPLLRLTLAAADSRRIAKIEDEHCYYYCHTHIHGIPKTRVQMYLFVLAVLHLTHLPICLLLLLTLKQLW